MHARGQRDGAQRHKKSDATSAAAAGVHAWPAVSNTLDNRQAVMGQSRHGASRQLKAKISPRVAMDRHGFR